jgi:hypothetical protein
VKETKIPVDESFTVNSIFGEVFFDSVRSCQTTFGMALLAIIIVII